MEWKTQAVNKELVIAKVTARLVLSNAIAISLMRAFKSFNGVHFHRILGSQQS